MHPRTYNHTALVITQCAATGALVNVTEYRKALIRLSLRSFTLVVIFSCAIFAAEVLGPWEGEILTYSTSPILCLDGLTLEIRGLLQDSMTTL